MAVYIARMQKGDAMSRYSVEIGDQPYFQRRKLEKKARAKPVVDSRLMRRAVPYRENAPVQPAPVVHQAMPVAPVFAPVVYVPVMPAYPPARSGGEDMSMFLGGGVAGGVIVGLFALFLAVLI